MAFILQVYPKTWRMPWKRYFVLGKTLEWVKLQMVKHISLTQLQNCISWTSNLNTISATTLINSLPVILWRDFKLHEGDIYVKSLIAEVRSASYPSSSHNPGWLWQHWNVSSGPLLLTRVLRLGHLVIILSLSFVSVKGHGSSKKLPKINSCDTFRYDQDEPLPEGLQGGCSFCL